MKENLDEGWGCPCQAAAHFKVLPKLIGQKLQCPKALSNEHILGSKEHLKHSEKQVVHLKDMVWKTNSPCIRDNTYQALSFWPRHLWSYRSGGSGRVKQHHCRWLIISKIYTPFSVNAFPLNHCSKMWFITARQTDSSVWEVLRRKIWKASLKKW